MSRFQEYLPGKGDPGGGEETRDVDDGVPECVAWVEHVRSGNSSETYGGSNMADNAKIVKSGLRNGSETGLYLGLGQAERKSLVQKEESGHLSPVLDHWNASGNFRKKNIGR